jgi:hypothetical protein
MASCTKVRWYVIMVGKGTVVKYNNVLRIAVIMANVTMGHVYVR